MTDGTTGRTRRVVRFGLSWAVITATIVIRPGAQAPSSPPQFRTGVDVVVVEATVLDRQQNVVRGLGPTDFTAEVGGKRREVVSVDLVEYAMPSAEAPPSDDLDITTNEPDESGRTILLLVDQSSLRPEARGIIAAARRWVESLGPKDRVGLIGFPRGAARLDLTTDHARIAAGLDAMVGSAPRPQPFSARNVSVWEAIRIEDGDTFTRNDVIARECRGIDPACERELDMQAKSVVFDGRAEALPVLESLRSVVRGLGSLPGPKHAVLISAGWALSEREAATEMGRAAVEAARANMTVHTLTTESWALAASRSKPTLRPVQDQLLLLSSVEMLSSMTGGRAVRLGSSHDAAFTALNGGLAGYYRVGIGALPEDLDGKEHRVSLRVTRSGASLSSYRRVLVAPPPAAAATADPEVALREALKGGPPRTALGLRATTYVLHGTGAPRDIRVVVTGDIARAAAGKATVVAALYHLDGRPVTARETTVEVPAADRAGLSISLDAPPGSYAFRLAVRDAEGRVGSLERIVDATWKKAGRIETPGLVLFRSRPGGGAPAPIFDGVGAGDEIVVQLAVVGDGRVTQTPVEIDLRPAGGTSALIRRSARVTQTTGGQSVVHETLPASLLPPGRYTVNARVGPTVLSRRLTVRPGPEAPPSAATGSTPATPAAAASGSTAFARTRFTTAAVLDPALVDPAVERLAARPDVKARFSAGLGKLQRGELDDAANEFRAALRAAPDFAPALVYLGACYAAGAKDREAAGAWQMALVREPSPAVQRLAIEAWLRADRPASAQALIAKARERWPDDPAFPRLHAQATMAEGRIAEGIELIVALKDPDPATLLLALGTLYDAGRRGAPIGDAARNLETMRQLRERYAAVPGESIALVDAWIVELAGTGR
jgi:VWFA-related protein